MSESSGGWTRRRFLETVGLAGGASAVYETMTVLGLINVPEAWAGPPQLPGATGSGKSVLILGAGVGGLTLAYELSRAGFRCEILEAQERAGGRSLTARQGTVIAEESSDGGVTRQECRFDPGLYLNMGPGRLPYHHRRVLHYCHELGVPLEIYVMETTANLFQTDRGFGGKAMVNRRIANDARGYIAELLAKAVDKGSLNQELTKDDKEKLLDLLKVFGDLGVEREGGEKCPPDSYCGSTRSGCADPLTVFTSCEPEPKLALHELLRSEFWKYRFYQPVDFEWQPTLFQPVGGMDQIVHGFTRRIGHLIHYHSVVLAIRLLEDGVEVTVRDGQTGETTVTRADYCVSNIPLPLLKQIPANFSKEFKQAVDQGRFAPTCKVGWQANKRFWETDDEIYGGISWINDPITQMWYPSYDYFTANGTLTGAYNYSENAIALGRMSLEQRLVTARKGAVKLHPEFGDDAIVPQRLGLSVAWQNVPFQRGGWASWGDKEGDDEAYARLLEPDGRFHVLGDQVSTLPGWQEGAMMSAEHVLGQIAAPQALKVPGILRAPGRVRAPRTQRLVEGRS
ncbi:MAG TPA: FAD-dependent oxidoreductase [Thermoanaerobaculia bacterium]|nr:FAD-dependent oxidoreductase [Thermoanaerobaculia bacterium]